MNLQQEMAHKKFINCTKMMEFGYLATFYITQNNSGKNQKRKIIPTGTELRTNTTGSEGLNAVL
jgi:hypothetical protein